MAWNKLKPLSAELFHHLYVKERKNIKDIATIFGVSRMALYKWFHRNKLEVADTLERRSGNKKGYVFNQDFFNVWTPEMAYVLGVLATDGNVGKYYVSLTSTDLELVEKVRALLKSDHPIHIVLPRGFSRKTQYALKISSTRLASRVTKSGVGPVKSLTLEFPETPEECIRHFIRGCWDGDGSFYFESPRGRYCESMTSRELTHTIQHNRVELFRASYVSGSKRFIEAIICHLQLAGISTARRRKSITKTDGTRRSFRRIMKDRDKATMYETRRGKNVSYSFRLAGPNALALGRFLYESVPESMYLTRKFEKFRAVLPQTPLG